MRHDYNFMRHDYTVKQHDYNDKRNDYKYSKCNRVFSTAVGLSVHMAAKCHGYQYECPVCQVRFASE